jgi:mRNA interferase MazF
MDRGNVVLVDWPYSDRTGSKLRPAVVVQADFLNAKIDDTVLIAVTRTGRSASTIEVVIDPASESGSGLRHRSIASCNNFLTIDQAYVIRVIGTLSTSVMRQIDGCLKTALELP